MDAELFFHCPHCANMARLTISEYRQVGIPHCPAHQEPMVTETDTQELNARLDRLLGEVAVLAAQATLNTHHHKSQKPHEDK